MEEERRKTPRFCEGHIQLCEDIAVIKSTVLSLDKRINGSIDTIEKHIENSRGRNIAIGSALVSIVIFLFTLAYQWGISNKQIQVNTERWNRVLESNPVTIK
jgi:hypothetical protein